MRTCNFMCLVCVQGRLAGVHACLMQGRPTAQMQGHRLYGGMFEAVVWNAGDIVWMRLCDLMFAP